MGKLFIVGPNGYIASHIALKAKLAGYEVLSIGRTNCDSFLDLARADQFNPVLLHEGDFVLFAAAISSPDACKNDRETCWRVNVEGTSRSIEMMLSQGARVMFLSSDAVFASEPACIYDEQSAMNPQFPYGEMKAEVERRFESNGDFKALRLSYVFSRDDKFTKYLIRCAAEKSEAEVFHPYYRSCVSLGDVVKSILWLCASWSDFAANKLNLAGDELVSRIRHADEIRRFLYPDLKYSIAEPDSGFYESRPAITQMTSLYLHDLGIVERGTFSEKLWEELEG